MASAPQVWGGRICFSDMVGMAVVTGLASVPLISHCPRLFKPREDPVTGRTSFHGHRWRGPSGDCPPWGPACFPLVWQRGALLTVLWEPIAIGCLAHSWFKMDLVAVIEWRNTRACFRLPSRKSGGRRCRVPPYPLTEAGWIQGERMRLSSTLFCFPRRHLRPCACCCLLVLARKRWPSFSLSSWWPSCFSSFTAAVWDWWQTTDSCELLAIISDWIRDQLPAISCSKPSGLHKSLYHPVCVFITAGSPLKGEMPSAKELSRVLRSEPGPSLSVSAVYKEPLWQNVVYPYWDERSPRGEGAGRSMWPKARRFLALPCTLG